MTLIGIDTETTGLDTRRHEWWELALVTQQQTYRFLRWPDMRHADATALRIGRFYSHDKELPSGFRGTGVVQLHRDGAAAVETLSVNDAARLIATITDGAHLVGVNPSFDAAILGRWMTRNGAKPTWHYHLIDVPVMAVGYLAARGEMVQLPWRSDALSRQCDVEPPTGDARHTAVGDATWAIDWYYSMCEGERP